MVRFSSNLEETCYDARMDIIALTFYAIICGVLSFASPAFGKPMSRLAIGAVVGIAAAAVLPYLKAALAA